MLSLLSISLLMPHVILFVEVKYLPGVHYSPVVALLMLLITSSVLLLVLRTRSS